MLVDVYPHIDWLTLTIPSYHEQYYERVEQWQSIISHEQKQGNLIKPIALNGYTGFGAGSTKFGLRTDGAMLELTGSAADKYFIAAFTQYSSTTRMDIAVTVRFSTEDLSIAKECYANAVETNNSRPNQTKRKLYIISGSDGGDTCYIGAPSSEQRGRIYNKEKQSNEAAWKNCWRYEVQFRNKLAQQAAEACYAAQMDRSGVVTDMVKRWFLARGVDTPFTANGSMAALPTAFRQGTDVARKLDWLKNQVRPTIHQLIENGWYNEVYQALALVPPDNEENQAVS